jgi:hypothetical protein
MLRFSELNKNLLSVQTGVGKSLSNLQVTMLMMMMTILILLFWINRMY